MDQSLLIALVLLGGSLLGGVVTWVVAAGRHAGARAADRVRLVSLEKDLELARHQASAHAEAFERAESRFREAFQSLAGDALRANADQFITRAGEAMEAIRRQSLGEIDQRRESIAHLVAPIREHLEKVTTRVDELDRIRQEADGALRQHLTAMQTGQREVAEQTRHLVQALRAPQTRGRWGELQLQRVVELAGMAEHVDFEQQATFDSDAGKLRPDLVVRLPGGRTIVVDAKTPLDAYLRAVEAVEVSSRELALRQHGQQLRTHVTQLAGKGYWDQFTDTPDFVVMFVPGEAFLSAACLEDPRLLEDALEKKVILASPTMLVALLRTVALGWRQEKLAEHAERISEDARELLDRLAVMAEHFDGMGDKLRGAVKAYDQTVATLESRVLVTGRRIREHGVSGKKELPELTPIGQEPRRLSAAELTEHLPPRTNEQS